ncbi:hypothetical protein LTSEMON_2426 [Salmonella enterica subsp. enterica serovar Montevideo str. S5-403]|uniref:Uncharacterized protein n=1 Tax=Salmonella enterica subsp. enterica serovar Montevideo str. S5-403 TaxID=913242 RepID=G5Q374_SALMO|nr:hypothetical protein LTSEMON_2426 [Salmonella enterica subsp. enterica serovar Montevideo str. S5-403]
MEGRFINDKKNVPGVDELIIFDIELGNAARNLWRYADLFRADYKPRCYILFLSDFTIARPR